METSDALTKILTELLIENRVMRTLLRKAAHDFASLDEALRTAKADTEIRQWARDLAVKAKAALENEAACEQLLEEIAKVHVNKYQA